MRLRRQQGGFSLLEAIVAMVIVALAGGALFTWASENLAAYQRISDVNAMSEAKQNIAEYMESINPMTAPEGEARFGAYSLRWKAELVTPETDGVGYPAGLSRFRMGLYDTKVRVYRGDLPKDGKAPSWFDFTLRMAGYKVVRGSGLPF